MWGARPRASPYIPYWAAPVSLAPQLNAIVSLMVQGLGHRIGRLNVSLYEISNESQGYSCPGAPLRAITPTVGHQQPVVDGPPLTSWDQGGPAP